MNLGPVGVYLGAVIFLAVVGIGLLWRKPTNRHPDPPPGYYEWLKKTTKKKE